METRKLNFRRVCRDSDRIKDIQELEESISALQVLKRSKRFPANQIDNEIAYFKQAQEQIFSELVGASENWELA